MLISVCKKWTAFVFALTIVSVSACKTTESTGLRDYANGINETVKANAINPTYIITESVGAAGSGYAYMIENVNGRWRTMYDSFDAKAFAKPAGTEREVPVDAEVLWTDGASVAVYFGTEALTFSKTDGSFPCPKNNKEPSHRACRSQFTEAKSLLGGLGNDSTNQPFVLDIDTIKQAVADTRIVAIAKKRISRDK